MSTGTAEQLAVPTIHLNGTSADRLLEAIEAAYARCGEALDALCQCAPNGRDYYPQGPEAMDLATRQHWRRLEHVKAVRDELERLAIAIDEAR